jgi:uncharacterized protein (TIGR03435 family)
MKLKLISVLCILIIAAISASAQTAQTAQPGTKLPPPPPGAMQAPPPPTPEALLLAAHIAAYATAQCAGKGADTAPDCRIKALWAATQCPDQVTAQSAETKMETVSCKVPEGGFEYEVSSIKPHKNDGNNGSMVGSMPDGYRATNVTMQNTVLNAYYTGLKMEITGGPAWMKDERYDIEAKSVPEVSDAMKKLTREDRAFVQGFMLRQILKERMNFVAHVDTKEVPAYDLVVGKNGPKFKAADPGAKNNGSMMMRNNQDKTVITATGMELSNLAANLSGAAGRPVFDKTGLKGTYDLTLEYVRDQNMSATVPGEGPSGSGVPTPSDPSGPSLLAAVEDQLGLKLVPSRGPMQVVVIEHMDKPDAN